MCRYDKNKINWEKINSPCGISLYQGIAHTVSCFYPLLGRSIVIYLFVCLFSASLSYASTSLGIHKSSSFSLDHWGLAEEGVPSSRPILQSFPYSVFILILLCPPPHQGGVSCSCLPNSNWPYTQGLLCCWKISFHFLTCVQKVPSSPSGYASGSV